MGARDEGWVSSDQKDDLLGLLERIEQARPERAGVDHCLVEPVSIKLATLNKLQMGAKNKSSKVRNYLYGKYEGYRMISGNRCLIQAEVKMNKIIGKLSCSRSKRPFAFEFKPIPVESYKGQRVNFEVELQRLHFVDEYQEEPKKNGKAVRAKHKMTLVVKEAEDCDN